jgi:hypothetical protein
VAVALDDTSLGVDEIAPLGVIKGAPGAYDMPDRDYDTLRTEERIPFFPYRRKGAKAQLAWTHEGLVHYEYQLLTTIRAHTVESFACAHRPQYTQRGGARGRIEFWRHLNPDHTIEELRLESPIGEARLHGTGAGGTLYTEASEHIAHDCELDSTARGTIKRSSALLHSARPGNISAADAKAALISSKAANKRTKAYAEGI